MYSTFPSFRRQPPDAPQHRFDTLPLSVLGFPLTRVWASPYSSWLATTPGRIAFVILRTDVSPPVALHPASRRRSYLRLQAGERLPGGDLHPSDRVHFQAHWSPGLPGRNPWRTGSRSRPGGSEESRLAYGRNTGRASSAPPGPPGCLPLPPPRVSLEPVALAPPVDRDRGGSRDPTPPTPPCVRVRTRRFGRLCVTPCSFEVQKPKAIPQAFR